MKSIDDIMDEAVGIIRNPNSPESIAASAGAIVAPPVILSTPELPHMQGIWSPAKRLSEKITAWRAKRRDPYLMPSLTPKEHIQFWRETDLRPALVFAGRVDGGHVMCKDAHCMVHRLGTLFEIYWSDPVQFIGVPERDHTSGRDMFKLVSLMETPFLDSYWKLEIAAIDTGGWKPPWQ